MDKKVAIVIPAWNEAERLPAVLSDLKTGNFAVIVVDDGSSDSTSQIAADYGAIVLRHIINRYQGAALRTGTRFAVDQGFDIIVHFDADGQFRAQDIPAVVEPLLENSADIVFGSRFLDSTTSMPAFKRSVIMPIARAVNYFFYGIRMTDPQSGFRAFDAATFGKIEWRQDGMAHCSEILHLAHKKKLRIVEVPITVIYHEFGQKFSAGFNILKDLFLGRFIN
jgi:glycosyltransferase involved in cell wall biosynthesis